MDELTGYVIKHWSDFSQMLAALVTIATIVTGLTPSSTDNAIVEKILNLLERFSILGRTEGIVEKSLKNK